MPTVEEKPALRVGTKTVEVPYIVFDAESADSARDAALAEAETSYDGMPMDDAEAVEIAGADGTYEVTIRYSADQGTGGSGSPLEEGGFEDGFEIAVTPTTVYCSRETVTTDYAETDPPDFKGAINVDEDGQVHGVEWPPSTPQIITRSTAILPASMTQTYYRTVSALVGKVNVGAFLGFQAREVLFLGMIGSRRGSAADDLWDVTFKFAISLSAVNIKVGPSMTIASKDGWDYLWVHFRRTTDSTAKLVIPRPVAAYVERIAEDADFTQLNPPVGT